MKKQIAMMVVMVLVLMGCENCKSPNDPSEPSKQVSAEVTYERVAPINNPGGFNRAFLKSRRLTPNGWIPPDFNGFVATEMQIVDEKTLVTSLVVWTEYENILWISDFKNEPGDPIAQNIYVDGVLLTKSEYGGPVGLYGRVKFIKKNDGSIIQP